MVGSIREWRAPKSVGFLARELEGYDSFIGSGLSPAILDRIGKSLDIYFPYSTGIEFYGTLELLAARRSSILKRFILNRLRVLQARGIVRSKFRLNAELSLTKRSFEEIGATFLPYFLPAVYNVETIPSEPPSGFESLVAEMKRSDFVVFSHARQLWVKKNSFSDTEWRSQTKNSNFLIHGFARFIRTHSSSSCLLVLLEYGEDVAASKRLCEELDVTRFVRWIPKTERKNLTYLLQCSHVGIGEFYLDEGVIWGGTGWEVIAAGKPLIQSFNFDAKQFERTFNVPVPPILDAKSSGEVTAQLESLFDDRQLLTSIGSLSKKWFDSHGGIGLAKKWLDLLRGDSSSQ